MGRGGPTSPSRRRSRCTRTRCAGLRQRFVEEGLEAAVGRKRQGRPSRAPLLDGEQEARLIALRCSAPPPGHGRWTLHLLADQLVELQVVESISYETVRKALKKTH